MARYYFDVYDSKGEFRDKVGMFIAPMDIATEARKLLRLLVYERVPFAKPSMIVAEVRNEAGRVVYHASAELRRWAA